MIVYHRFGRRPRRRCGLAFSSRFLLLRADERIVSEAASGDRLRGLNEPLRIIIFPIVESVALLVQVSEKVERLNTNIGAFDRTLEKTPEVLKTVSVYGSLRVADRVIHYVVDVLGGEAVVRLERVRIDYTSALNVSINLRVKSRAAGVADYCDADCAMSLRFVFAGEHSHYRDLAASTCAGDDSRALGRVHVPRLAADVSFINFNFAANLSKRLCLHCEADAVKHEPRGFLCNFDRAGKLVTTNPVFTINDHPHRGHPLRQRNRRILENGADLDAELFLASATLEHPAGRKERHRSRLTLRANGARRPPEVCYELVRYIRVREVGDRFQKGLRGHGSVVHAAHSNGELR